MGLDVEPGAGRGLLAGVLVLSVALGLSGCGLLLDIGPPDADSGTNRTRRDASPMDGARRPDAGTRDAGRGPDAGGPDAGCLQECDDGLACNGVETCVDGSCQDGVAPCDDGLKCTEDPCTEGLGGPECGDPVLKDDECDDRIPCTEDVCQPGHTRVDRNGCIHRPIDARCEGPEGDSCELEICVPEIGCVDTIDPRLCSVGYACSLSGHCLAAPETTPCSTGIPCRDDGNPCNGEERCVGGACVSDGSCPASGSACREAYCKHPDTTPVCRQRVMPWCFDT